jgi:hypothetical protein
MWLDDNFVSERKNKRYHHRPLVCGSKKWFVGLKTWNGSPFLKMSGA